MKTLRNRNQKGFTLIELLVVIAIIGLLASVVLLALNSARAKARDAKRVADIRQVQSGLELYFNDCSSYPIEATAVVLGSTNAKQLQRGTTTATCGDNSGSAVANGGIAATTASAGTLYIALLPTAPAPEDGGCSAAQNDYSYSTSSASSYALTFCLGGTTGGLQAGVHTATEGGIQ